MAANWFNPMDSYNDAPEDTKFRMYLETLDPEQRALIEEQMATDPDGATTKLKQQMAMAKSLRETPTPEGRQVGQVFQASNPMEHIGARMQQFAGLRDAKDAIGEYDTSLEKQRKMIEMLQKMGIGRG